jgi:hypothetical protein
MSSSSFRFLSVSFQPHYGPGVDSASNRNEYQESSWGLKGGRRVRLTYLPPPVSWLSRENVGTSTSHNPMGLHGLLQGQPYLTLPYLTLPYLTLPLPLPITSILTQGPTQPPIQWVPRALSPGVKRQGLEADHSPPYIAEIKKVAAIPPFPYIRIFMA